MNRPPIQLQNEDGSHSRFITPSELRDLLTGERVTRVYRKRSSRSVFRLKPPVKPSESKASPGGIMTAAEVEAYAGVGNPGAIMAARAKMREIRKTAQRHIVRK